MERAAGLDTDTPYVAFLEQARETKRSLLELQIRLKRQGKSIVGYGADAKGNTLLNDCGIGADILDFVVDRSPYKQGMFLPGTCLEIWAPKVIDQCKPDYVLIPAMEPAGRSDGPARSCRGLGRAFHRAHP